MAKLNNFKASTKVPGGIKLASSASDLPLAEAHDIMVDENDTRLDAALDTLSRRVLPSVTQADNGKVLTVKNGAWTLETPTTYKAAEGVTF